METVLSKKYSWENITLFKRIEDPIDDLILESNQVEHHNSDEENALHRCRNRINQYEETLTNGKNWEYYKKIVNPFEIVYTQKKYPNFPESICYLKPLSRSYFKMIEMLDLTCFFDQFPKEEIRSAHVCEGPGGFIEALFDEAVRQKRIIQTSLAMTLKSRKTNIPGWKRATYFLQKNKNVRILFGKDHTGDIMKSENQQYFIDYSNQYEKGTMHLFTADGGFDFSCDYTKQETMVFPLLLASTKIGLEVLKVGGVFVLKMFDFYHQCTLDLLRLLSFHFEEWTLYKPCMSRPCNPEHYFIGKGFTGCSDKVLDVMRLWCSMIENNQPLESLFSNHDASGCHSILQILRKSSFHSQTEYLEQVFSIIDTNQEETIRSYLKRNERASFEWCVRFKVPISSRSFHLAEALHNDRQASSPQ
jgi:23S rRNA U2552 (ribose-2'-O)-methylase RlmE/FtsJ